MYVHNIMCLISLIPDSIIQAFEILSYLIYFGDVSLVIGSDSLGVSFEDLTVGVWNKSCSYFQGRSWQSIMDGIATFIATKLFICISFHKRKWTLHGREMFLSMYNKNRKINNCCYGFVLFELERYSSNYLQLIFTVFKDW